jgi:SET domain-containing protein
MIECSPGACPQGEQCQNQRFRRQQNAEVEARPTFDKGWGLFACEPVETDTFMIEYCGEVIENDECERRIQEALKYVWV